MSRNESMLTSNPVEALRLHMLHSVTKSSTTYGLPTHDLSFGAKKEISKTDCVVIARQIYMNMAIMVIMVVIVIVFG